jgi:thiamine pyrophosphate-dependent acetolactate synthase large subunit-like protein
MAIMGYTVLAALGVSAALGDKRLIAIVGDESLFKNQELQSILHYKLPIKLFI